MKTYQIHFVRHGLTDGNVKGQYIGSKDIPLNEAGKEQIRHWDAERVYPGAAAYFISPMQRCRETFELIYPNAKPIAIDAFRECDFGEFEGLTAEELKDNEAFAAWLASGGTAAPPNGESGEMFGHRVCQAFEKIVEALMVTGTPSALVVTHGGVISTILSRYGLPEAPVSDWMMAPGSGFSVRIHPQLWTSGRKVEVYQRIPYARRDEEAYEKSQEVEDVYLIDAEAQQEPSEE